MTEKAGNQTYEQYRDFNYMGKLKVFVRTHKEEIEKIGNKYRKLGKFFANQTGIELSDDQREELGSDMAIQLVEVQKEGEIEDRMAKLRKKKDKQDEKANTAPIIPDIDYGPLKRK